jgi:hypothetical protein
MDISGVAFSTASAIGAYASQSQGGSARQTPADTAASQTASSAITRFSPQAQVKSSLEDLQAKAQALQNFSQSPNLQDFKVAVQGVVNALNVIRQAGASKEADTVTRQAAQNVGQAVFGANGENKTSLQKAGVEQQASGLLSLDQNQLNASLGSDRAGTLSALTQLASRVQSAASQPSQSSISSGNGNASPSAAENGNGRNTDEARLAAQKQAQQLADQQALASGYAARNAVASYFTVHSL